ncbi:putative reverse transcriptase domain, viral movement protein [Tanacetum coccineum]
MTGAMNWGTSGVLVEVTTSAIYCDSCEKDCGNGCGSNETPTKGVYCNLHGSSIREIEDEGVSFDPQPLPQSYTHTTSPSLNIWASEQRRLKPSTKKEPTFSQESQSIADVVTSTKTPDVLPIQKDYEEFDNVESFEHLFMAEPENAESTVQFDAEEYEEHHENPNQETPTEFPKSDIKQYFTFDDVPPSKWRERSIEMLTWCTAELQYYTIDVVIKRFLTRLQGCLKDCPWEHAAHAREEFLKMKCCSFQKKDLEKNYDRMSQRFYCLNIVDDVNLKQVFLNSFPESLGNEAYRALEARNTKFLAEFERTGKLLGIACDDKYLHIKCKDKSSCDCHFARNCSDKKRSQALIQALNQVEPVDVSNLESVYSLDDEPSDSVLCTIAYLYFSSDDDSDTDSLESDSDFGVHMINPIPHVLPIQEDPPLPLAKVYLFTDAYAKPIPVIAFFDTSSSISILNPNILPDHYWKPHYQNFMAANREKFVIDKISVPINIRLFPKCLTKRWLLGSSSHGKDLLIGFDILHKLPNLRWSGEGLHYRSFFNSWTAMHRLFVASITPPIFNISSIKQRLIQTYCASSHTELLTKHPLPLWLNPSFFVSLPFKQNEDVNPTKASHPGMNPNHYQLAKEECEQLVSQGIVKPTTSPWASDDKFPLPQKKSLFQHLADAKVLSKFDLKSGFWQLGIKPEDRLKTAFCIPDHHYQWKVMPFGLKNAPSAFQKAMITIFGPILANTLVYIDDILLFSPDEQSHAELISKFYSLVTKYGIMLSEKKMEVRVTTIQFLGKEISDGKY